MNSIVSELLFGLLQYVNLSHVQGGVRDDETYCSGRLIPYPSGEERKCQCLMKYSISVCVTALRFMSAANTRDYLRVAKWLKTEPKKTALICSIVKYIIARTSIIRKQAMTRADVLFWVAVLILAFSIRVMPNEVG